MLFILLCPDHSTIICVKRPALRCKPERACSPQGVLAVGSGDLRLRIVWGLKVWGLGFMSLSLGFKNYGVTPSGFVPSSL